MTAIALPGFSWRSILHRAAKRQRALMALQSPLAASRQVSGPLAVGKAGAAVAGSLIYDTFTDADGTLLSAHTPDVGGPWTTITGYVISRIVGNRAGSNGADTQTAAIATLVADCTLSWVTHTFTVSSTSVAAGIIVRAVNSGSLWRIGLLMGSNLLVIQENSTVRASAALSYVSNTDYVMTATLAGATITASCSSPAVATCTYNSATVNQATVTHGVYTRGNLYFNIDNFKCEV